MDNKSKDILFEINSNTLCLNIGDRAFISLNIKNNLDISLEKIYIYNFFNKDYLKIINYDENEFFVHDELIGIENINAKENKKIKFDLLLQNNSKDISLSLFSIIYYRININGKYIKKQIQSNKIKFSIGNKDYMHLNNGNLYGEEGEFIHIVDKQFAHINDIINNKIIINNKDKPKIKNLYFKDSSSEFLKYIKRTLFINGIPRNYDNINDYIYIQDSAQEEIVIEYKSKIIDMPINGELIAKSNIEYYLADDIYNENKFCDISSQCNIKIYENLIDTLNSTFKRYQDKDVVLIGDIIKFTVKIKNIGIFDISNLILKELLIPELKYIENSLTINNKNNINFDLNKPININKIKANESIKISYKVIAEKITEKKAFTKSSLTYEYSLLDDNKITKIIESNASYIEIKGADLRYIKKEVSNTVCKLGDTLDFNLNIINKGNISALNIKVKDDYISCFEFVEKSIYLNEINLKDENIFQGIYLDILNPKESFNIKYKLKFISIPKLNFVNFITVLEYNHVLNEEKTIKKEIFKSKDLILKIEKNNIDLNREDDLEIKKEKSIIKDNNFNIESSMFIFKELNINGKIILNSNEPDILEVSHLIVETEILKFYEIKTIKKISYGNQRLTGKKLIVEGIIIEKFEYIIDSKVKSLYFLERIIPFSTFIIIPYNYNHDNIQLNCKIKDIYFKNITNRKIFKSITVLIEIF